MKKQVTWKESYNPSQFNGEPLNEYGLSKNQNYKDFQYTPQMICWTLLNQQYNPDPTIIHAITNDIKRDKHEEERCENKKL